MRVLGIDLGSREVKIVLQENEITVDTMKLGTVQFYRDYCKYNGVLSVDLDKLGYKSINKLISTGYGRNNINLENFTPINELKAHVYGALKQTNLKDFILLDIGGQDVKVIKVEKGLMTDMELNQKCAASCGRFLENMANIMEVDLDIMGQHFKDPVELSATCAVFSESELIGKIAEGISEERLYAGINYSLYKRLKPILTRFRSSTLLLSGGVSHNVAIKKYLENDYSEVRVLESPQFNGAMGCCYYGYMRNKYV